MTLITKLIALARPLLLVLMTAIAGAAYAQILFLSLPISKALGLFTVVLPLITGVSTHGTSILVRRASKNEQAQLTLPFLTIIGFQLIYETIIATLAITHIIPPSTLKCGLENKWEDLFKARDGRAIQAIQDSFKCCGFNSVKDRAWPFPTSDEKGHTVPSTCSQYTGRTNSCFGEWRKAEQINAGLLFTVAIVVFIVKLLSVISLLTNSAWARPRWAKIVGRITDGGVEHEGEDSRATVTRLIEEGNPVEVYHDDPEAGHPETVNTANGNGRPTVVPSQLSEHGNEWRD